MDKKKRERLHAAGWSVGTVQEFLGLSDADAALIEIRVVLSDELRKQRVQKGMTQTELAALLASSQSRVAKMEGGDPSVSIDLLIRSLLATGRSPADIGRVVAKAGR